MNNIFIIDILMQVKIFFLICSPFLCILGLSGLFVSKDDTCYFITKEQNKLIKRISICFLIISIIGWFIFILTPAHDTLEYYKNLLLK